MNAGTSNASLSSLTPGTSYTYKAYNRAGCAAADRIAVAISFTTLGIVLNPAALTVTEGSTATYTAKLATRPTGNVKITIARTSGDTDLTISATDCDLVTSGTQLCFTTTTYNSPQTITVTAAQDTGGDAGTATITHTATGANYASVTATLVATEADNEPRLSIAAYTHNSATLTIANHTTAWYYEHTGAAATCSSVVSAGTDTVTATNLTTGTFSTYEAFSDSNCTSSNKLATATAFTTHTAAPTLTTSAVTSEGVMLTVGNYTGPWYHKHTLPAGGSCSARIPTGTTTAQVGILIPSTSYTYKAYTDSSCATELASAAAFTTHTATTLAASDVTHNSATLTIGNHAGNWYYQRVLPPGGTCSTQISTTTADLTKLTPGASYTYRAFRDSTCSTGIATASFATSGIFLTPFDLTIAEGSTTTIYRSGASTNGYTVSLATPPGSGKVKVTITLAGDPEIGVAATDCDTSTRNIDLCFTRSYYDTPQTVVLTAAEDSDNLDGSATITHTATGADYDNSTAATLTATAADNDPILTATAITTDSATITIANTTGAWYYKHATGTCSSQVPAWRRSVNVTTLTAATSYTYTAYTDVNCSTALATAESFTTLTGAGIALTPTSLTVTEGSTATYTIKLATKPTGTVKVAIARTAGDTDISVTGPTDCDTQTTGRQICFTTTTWNNPQTVTLAASQDSDDTNGAATITHTAAGANHGNVTTTLTATENDDDTSQQLPPGLPILPPLEPSTTPVDVPPFEDVPDTSAFKQAIDKIRAAGITLGCNADGTLFCPDQPVARGQMAAFLARALDL